MVKRATNSNNSHLIVALSVGEGVTFGDGCGSRWSYRSSVEEREPKGASTGRSWRRTATEVVSQSLVKRETNSNNSHLIVALSTGRGCQHHSVDGCGSRWSYRSSVGERATQRRLHWEELAPNGD
jgi:hypothetical protein